ncbi:MAG: hypothetical protein KJ970_12420 [Candidatus Eisenbacteria bacterium]|uniref:Uncharacterized protein n=1 Tax=Eiseniibacteriota bacterium TaxID=2212470 RepID=A0A948RYY9_UNCEI|nr:hypothetical protein [Candidatus Eisenbacteria bacterium]
MNFNVNPALLGDSLLDLSSGFSLYAPSGWKALPDSIVWAVMEHVRRAEAYDPPVTPVLRAVFRNEKTGAYLSVSKYPKTEVSSDSIITNQERLIRTSYAEEEIHPTTFKYKGFIINQFMVITSEMVLIKLFADRPETILYQMDYFLPLSIYKDELGALESSIGSLNHLDTKERR